MSRSPKEKAEVSPSIYPDYVNVTIPSNISPINFGIEDADYIKVKISSINSNNEKGSIELTGKNYINIPLKKWKKLLSENIEKEISISVAVWNDKYPEGIEYKPFNVYVSKDTIDSFIAYRLVDPGYAWGEMGIYQRNLSTFDEIEIVSNRDVRERCFNCHSFCNNDADVFMFYERGKNGGTIIKDKETLSKVDLNKVKSGKATTYPSWHPSGNYIAFSCNATRQSFYKEGSPIEVYDLESDLVVYDRKGNQLLSIPELSSKENLETFPTWSPDGKFLYYCGAEIKEMPYEKDSLKYSICRISFDQEKGILDNHIDTLFVNETFSKSVSFPKISYDNKYLLYTESGCGTFPIWHKEAELKMIDLENNSVVDTDILNSNETESYHCWSKNSKWIVFSSRRDDGRYTRLYFAYLDDNGKWHKPFLLPQKNPYHNIERLKSYNIPELVNKKITINKAELNNLL